MRRNPSVKLVVAVALLAPVTIVSGGLIRVPGDYPTIQEGLNAAWINDTVLVAAGVYLENISWPVLNGIVLLSESGPDSTIIDGGGLSCVVAMSPYIDTTTVIDGFTIRNGDGLYAGGILCGDYSSPWIRNSRVVNNQGGGIACGGEASPLIEGNTIGDNTAVAGGGIRCSGYSSPTIRNNTISNNTSSGFGGGILINDSSPIIEKCRIVANTASGYGGGIHFQGDSFPFITGNTITENTAGLGAGITCHSSPYPPIRYNNIYANSGYGVYNLEPSYVVVATYNWWGDSTGPYHPTLNPEGLGDTVGDYIDFVPWLIDPVGVEEEPKARSKRQQVTLSQNYPNPFRLNTAIEFTAPKDGKVTLEVYDLSGRLVRTLIDDHRLRGTFAVHWDGRDETGRRVASGVYFCRLRTDRLSQSRRMVLLR